jgi:CHAT domain-containing protein/Tfp pilus assembly protein PilF
MGRTRTIVVAACLGIGLLAPVATVCAQTSKLQDQITEHVRKLAEARAAHHTRDLVLELIGLGYLYREAGRMQDALDCLNEALPIEQKAGNEISQAMTLNTLGRVYTDLGQEDKALALFEQALPMWRSAGISQGEANALTSMGRAYNNLGRRPEALKRLNEALSIWNTIDSGQGQGHQSLRQLMVQKRMDQALPNMRDALGRAGEANTLDNLGQTYSGMGQGKEALDYFNKALPIWREEKELGGEALTLNNMGRVYADLGQKRESLDVFNRALEIWRTVGNRPGEALTLNNTGRLFRDLGQHETALNYYNQALPVWREVRNRIGEALVLNDIGRAYADLGQGRKALEYFDQSSPIWRETGSRRGEAMTLNNAGRVWSDLGEAAKALDLDYRALAIWREVQDRRGEALALMTIGWACYAQKDPDKALASTMAALALAKATGDPEVEGGIETSLMVGFRDLHRREEAILFGIDAVNSYQQIRKNISGMDKDLRAGFAQSKSSTYRILAELLVQADRLGEAERVLDLLKEQELKEVVRGAGGAPEDKAEPLKLSPTQQAAQNQLEIPEKAAAALTDLSVEYARLSASATRSPQDTARMKALESKIEAANGEVSDFFRKTLYPQLAQQAGTQDANALLSREKSEVSRLQTTLAALGPHVMGVRMLLGDEHAYAIVVTAQARKKFELKATPAELRSKVLQVRDDLRTPASDPRPHLAELYAMAVAPLGEELSALEGGSQDKGRVPTLLWSLDGALRYVPMAALYDGRRYMAERFNNILFTPESYGHMAAPADTGKAALRMLAMGLSKSYGGLPALPGVLAELDGVAHDPAVPESHGPLDGMLLPNERFTYAALKTQLGAGSTFSVVHIASHFVLESESGKEPYLMLGGDSAGEPGGYQLTLSKLEDSAISFHGTRLLTLSACSTAKGDVAKDGLEMDSLGMIAQQKDAEAVLATLWDVNDASTSRLMSDFYARWVKGPAEGKAEALRQAQLAFLRGPATSPGAGSDRGVQPVGDSTAAPRNSGYAHPYYWAPFVLIGNYQ